MLHDAVIAQRQAHEALPIALTLLLGCAELLVIGLEFFFGGLIVMSGRGGVRGDGAGVVARPSFSRPGARPRRRERLCAAPLSDGAVAPRQLSSSSI